MARSGVMKDLVREQERLYCCEHALGEQPPMGRLRSNRGDHRRRTGRVEQYSTHSVRELSRLHVGACRIASRSISHSTR